MLKYIPLLFLMLFFSEESLAQSYNSKSKKAVKCFQKAVKLFDNDKYKSLELADKALSLDENFTDALLLKAELCHELNDDTTALLSYERILEIDSMDFPKIAISLSKLYAEFLCFDNSIKILNWYLSLENQKKHLREIAEHQLILSEFQKSLVENPVNYNPINIGNVVNSSDDEYVNQFYVNDNKLIFTKKYKINDSHYDLFEENVFVSTLYDSVWIMPQLLLSNVNKIGAANISYDDNKIYFSACADPYGSCDIYYVYYENGNWSQPINIRSINSSEWESQPCVSYDGKDLFFVRADKKLGTSDIFISHLNDNNEWSKPYCLDSVINTKGNEMAPFIHHDGKTLYFSSDTHLGMGGYDLFMSQRNDRGEWTKPQNLGYPLNTHADEINIVISNDASTAFISSDKDDGKSYDIYRFDLDENFRPRPVELSLPSDEDLYAEKLNRQETIVLNNIYFDFDSSELSLSSETTVDLIVTMLNTYPDLKIEIIGHTDDMGDAYYNIVLSKKRADAVMEALINKGVSSDRIKTTGLGASKPLVPNDIDEYRTINRRVEIKKIQ